VTLDPYDSTAIIVNVTAKSSTWFPAVKKHHY
jgi:hypothetical protein